MTHAPKFLLYSGLGDENWTLNIFLLFTSSKHLYSYFHENYVQSIESNISEKIYLVYVYECFAYMHIWAPQDCHACCLQVSKGTGSPGTGIMDGGVLPCRFWKPNPDPLQEQWMVPRLLNHQKDRFLTTNSKGEKKNPIIFPANWRLKRWKAFKRTICLTAP